MNLVLDLPYLFYSVRVRLETLNDALHRLPLGKFPTESGETLVSLFKKGTKRLGSLLDERERDWVEGTKDRDSIKGAVRRLADSATILYSYMEYLEAFCFEKTRPEVILPFELLMKAYFPKTEGDIFIFYPQWDYNFAYFDLKERLTRLLFLGSSEEEKEFFKEVQGRIPIVSFPALERDNILALVVLAHELAHYLDRDPDANGAAIFQSDEVQNTISIPEEKLKQWIDMAKKLDPITSSLPPLFADIYHKSQVIGKLHRSIRYWLRELTADLLASRLLGIGFYLSAKEVFGLLSTSPDSPYPPNWKRMAEVAKEIREINRASAPSKEDCIDKIIKISGDVEKKLLGDVKSMLMSDSKVDSAITSDHILVDMSNPSLTPDKKKELLANYSISIIEESVSNALLLVRKKVRQLIPDESSQPLTSDILIAFGYLKAHIPPAEKLGQQPVQEPLSLGIRTILNAAWLRWLEICNIASGESKGTSKSVTTAEGYYRELITLSRLSLRAIELSYFRQQYNPPLGVSMAEVYGTNQKLISQDFEMNQSGVLSKKEIVNLMVRKPIEEALVITPLLDATQITEASVDLRLGNVFILMKRATLGSLNFRKICEEGERGDVFEFQDRIQRRPEQDIVLHPNEFMLGSTLEYVALPNNVMAYVIGKSSLGRVGLVIATATHVAPGFKGTITLELSNLGSVPLVLYPTMLIAQLVFHGLGSPVEQGYSHTGAYACSVGPEFSKYLVRQRSE
jgi:dCTP deaminase